MFGGVLADDIGVCNNEFIVGGLALVPNFARGNEVDVRVE
jgi:hypothetical protein